jgi:hypothetical protein
MMADEEITYNGFTFSKLSHLKIHTELVYDDAGRTVVRHLHKIRVSTILSGEGFSTDSKMINARQLLTKVGGRLIIRGHGAGTIDVNGINRDVAFGPKPRVLVWEPIGGSAACEVVWECEASVSPCSQNPFADSGLAELNYEMSFDVDAAGFTRRTVSGHLEIAMTRVGRGIPDTADAYRETIMVPKPSHFKRVSQNYSLSKDKRRLNYTIVDEEIRSKNPWPEGVVGIKAEHALSYSRRQLRFPNTIQAIITLAKDQPPSRALIIFEAIVRQRLRGLSFAAEGPPSPNSDANVAILMGFDYREDLFGYEYAFRVDYEISTRLDRIIIASNLYQPLGGSWVNWAASMNQVESSRGFANLKHIASMDRIVDLCDEGSSNTSPNDPGPRRTPLGQLPGLTNVCPLPENSWLEFDASLIEQTDARMIFKTTLGEAQMNEKKFDPAAVDDQPNEIDLGDIESTIANAAPEMRWRWQGKAKRVCYKIPNPGILQVGEVQLIPDGRKRIKRKLEGYYFGVPVYQMFWDIPYRVKKRPNRAKEDIAVNPAEPDDEGEEA